MGRDLDRPKLLWVNVVLRMVQSETTYMLYPGNSGHARTHGVRWRNVCFLCSRFLFPALFCGASPLALGSKSFDQRGRSQTRSGNWASRRSGFNRTPSKTSGAIGKRHMDSTAGGLQQAIRAAQKPKMPCTGMCNEEWERLLQTVAVSACGCFSL